MKWVYVASCTLVAMVLLTVGCQSSLPRVKTIESQSQGARADASYVDSYLNVRNIDTRQIDDGLLQVHAQIEVKRWAWYQVLKKMTQRDISFQYRCIWMDSDGVPIETATSTWETLVLEVGSVKDLVFTAPVQKAKEWRIEIRYPK